MKHEELIRMLSGVLTVNQKEAIAVKEAVAIIESTRWRDPEYEPPEVDKDGESDYITLSFSNCSLPLIGRYRVDDEGGAYYVGDDERTLVSHGLFVDGWRPLPKNRSESNEN